MSQETDKRSEPSDVSTRKQLAARIGHHAGSLWAILHTTITNYAKHECATRAAAIAYYILLSFFPLTLLLIVLSSSLLKSAYMKAAVFDFINRYLPGAAQLVQLNIEQLLRRRGLTSVLSILGLIWSGGNVFASVHHSLNAIWDVQDPKSFWWQRLLSLASIGMILSMFVLSLATTAIGEIISNLPKLSWGLISVEYGRIWGRVATWIGIAPTILLFFTVYRLLSNAPFRWWELVPGSILSALSWEMGKQIFTNYVASFRPYNLVYGSLGKFIAFIIWSYYTAVILLLGAELTMAWKQVRHRRRVRHKAARQPLAPSRPQSESKPLAG